MRRRSAPIGALSSLRERNRQQVVDVLRRRGTASRADIARRTGLSRSTVSSLVGDLQESGMVVESCADGLPVGTHGGRPPVLLALDPAAGVAVGAELGQAHVRVALADLSSNVLTEERCEIAADGSAGPAIDELAERIDGMLATAGLDRDRVVGVGVSLPGPVDRETGEVGSSALLPSWAGLRPGDELAHRLGLPVAVDDDANLAALGEYAFGAGRGAADLVYVKLASGIGLGLVLGGRLHRGATGVAGELGHVIVDPDGPLCRCGNRGCLETRAAAPALLEALRGLRGDAVGMRDLLALVAGGDAGGVRLVADAGRAIGRVLADVVNCLNPGCVVVGGELGAAGEPLLGPIREALRRYALPAAADAVAVGAGLLGDRAGVLGAVALVIGDAERLSARRLSAV